MPSIPRTRPREAPGRLEEVTNEFRFKVKETILYEHTYTLKVEY